MPPRLLLSVAACAAVCALALVLGMRACAPSSQGAERAADAASDASSIARCTRAPELALLGEGRDVLVGEAVITRDGYAIGVVRSTGPKGKERHAGIVRIKSEKDALGAATFVDLGLAPGDLPPPRPFVHKGELFAAIYGRSVENRALLLVRIQDDGKVAPFAELPQERDESFAFDVVTSPNDGHGIVVWDEDAALGDAGVERGVIRVAPIPAGASSTPEKNAGVIISSSGADVERPHGIARAAGGFWIGWIARRRDPRGENDPKGLEIPGEDRAFTWVEVARVDNDGKRVGEVRRVTGDTGHATAFDWLAGADGKLDLFVRDDGEISQEGEGGRLLRIGIRDDGPQPSQALVARGVGQGDPAPLGDPGSRWLFYTDVAEHAQAVFLDVPSADAVGGGGPLEVPALDGQSPLLAKSAGTAALLLAVGASGEAKDQVEAHIVRCEPLNR